MKKNTHKMINRILVALLILGILVPVIFTAVEMGVFSPEPVVEVKVKATSDTAPVLKIATDYDFCPNSYYNDNQELSGLYIELMTEAANRLGMKPVFKTDNWMGCRKMLEDGDVDVLLGLEIFSNMQGTLRTIPVCSDELRVYGKNKIDSVAALAGKKVALMARSVIETTYDLQCDYVEYTTNTEILEAVENGEVDYGICHGAVATKIIEKNGFHLQSGLVIAKSYPALAVKETQPQLRDDLNKVLQEMSLDGTIGKLQNKWITEFTKNRSLENVIAQNELFYVTFSLGLVIALCITLGFEINARRQETYISTLLKYQEKLEESNKKAEKANLAKSEFLSHMSHDIRTPMNGILGMAEIIRENQQNPLKVEECLEKIDQASHHLLSLINDVLDMSKIGSGEIELEEIPINLEDEIKKIHAIVDVQVKERGISFQTHIEEVVHKNVMGSPAHIRRILLNLISNAIHYNKPEGSIELSIKEVKNENDFATFELKVQDTGIGMSKEFVKNNLFKPFTQENDKARTEYHGTGLGMSIVNELVTRMNGKIQVESQKGEGTTFTITLSMKINHSAPVSTPEKETEETIEGMNLLVVEDNELNLEIIQFILEEAGTTVTVAQDGKQAVEQFETSKEEEYDAILMDIMMPVMDGLEATRKIRKLSRKDAATIPIIAMTANAFAEDKKKTKEAGMNGHLTKPIDRQKLIHLLSQYRKN